MKFLLLLFLVGCTDCPFEMPEVGSYRQVKAILNNKSSKTRFCYNEMIFEKTENNEWKVRSLNK